MSENEVRKVDVGVGSKVYVELRKFHAKLVSLAGMQPKCEIVNAIRGTITKISPPENNELTETGKPNYLVEITEKSGYVFKIKRTDMQVCYSLDEE